MGEDGEAACGEVCDGGGGVSCDGDMKSLLSVSRKHGHSAWRFGRERYITETQLASEQRHTAQHQGKSLCHIRPEHKT